MEKSNLIKIIKYWFESSGEDLKVAQSLFNSKYYPQCLFFCHLSLEKMLKGMVVKITQKHPPYTHDLRQLAEIANISLNSQQKKYLDKIFTFNIAGRYADAKFEFYKKYNKKEIAKKYLKITKNLILWLRKESQKK